MTSTAIETIEYKLENGQLFLDLTFKSGGKYRYFDIPQNVFNDFVQAGSRGRFFQENIRSQYKFEKLN